MKVSCTVRSGGKGGKQRNTLFRPYLSLFLIVPDNGEMGLKDLEAMVKEVNATQVAPADKLTDSVYHYDSKEKIFELGEKFVQRQAEKEAERAEEKGEKSVLGDLKAKKEEVAKTPKKETIDKGAKSKGGEAL